MLRWLGRVGWYVVVGSASVLFVAGFVHLSLAVLVRPPSQADVSLTGGLIAVLGAVLVAWAGRVLVRTWGDPYERRAFRTVVGLTTGAVAGVVMVEYWVFLSFALPGLD